MINNIIKIKPIFGDMNFILPKSFVQSKISYDVFIHKDKNEYFNYEWLFNTVRKYAPNTLFVALLFNGTQEHMFIFNETGMFNIDDLRMQLHEIKKEEY